MWRRGLSTAILTVLFGVGVVQAHFIWIERDDAGPARAYFGEWADDVREKTGGALDRIKSPQAFLTTPQQVLPIERRDDHLAITVNGMGDIRLLEAGLPPRDDSRAGGKTRTVYYAKGGRTETLGKLDLELVPRLANGSTFVLMFQGVPLPEGNVTVYGPPKWEKSLRTDEHGQVTVPMPWAGRYVVEVTYIEEQAGEAEGMKFDRTRHVSTLSFTQQGGLPWSASR